MLYLFLDCHTHTLLCSQRRLLCRWWLVVGWRRGKVVLALGPSSSVFEAMETGRNGWRTLHVGSLLTYSWNRTLLVPLICYSLFIPFMETFVSSNPSHQNRKKRVMPRLGDMATWSSLRPGALGKYWLPWGRVGARSNIYSYTLPPGRGIKLYGLSFGYWLLW